MDYPISFRATMDIIETIDRIVIERRRKHPEVPFSRALFLKEATLRALGDAAPQVRIRQRVSV